MADETWPTTLPQRFSERGFRYRPKESKISNDPEVGPSRDRGRSTLDITLISGSIVVSRDQAALFKAFYNDDLHRGVDRFNWKDPLDYSRAVEMKFINPQYQIVPAGGIDLRITMSVEMYG